MGKIVRKIIILLNIFLAAIMIYFVWSQNTLEKSELVYTSMEEPSLPLVYTKIFEYDMNSLHGYRQEMSALAARDTLTVLPVDRKLNLTVDGFGLSILRIRYEIRNLALDQLVERTVVEQWEEKDGLNNVALPIQNLLNKDEEYLLHLYIDTERHGTVHYYTRIVWTNDSNTKEMIDLAMDFSNRTLDYEQARDLVTYLESNEMADNSSFGKVTIESSFSQLTWGNLKVQRVGDMQVRLKELDGIMGQVQVDYVVAQGMEGEQEFYEVRDYYTMKWNAQRIYLMDFVRETNQIFSGKEGMYSGKRVLLGIMNEDQMQVEKSKNEQYLTYVVNRDLWRYDQKSEQSTYIFSFRDDQKDIRSNYNQHSMKVVSVSDDGDVYFLLYGYMNRGNHEGDLGITFYKFNHETMALEEKFFITSDTSFEVLHQEIQQIIYLRDYNLLYLFLNQTIYAIDINSNEYMIVAENLNKDNFAVSLDHQYIAWQENHEESKSRINWMNLETGLKNQIVTQEDANMRILGFVGHDFIYGLYQIKDQWNIHGRKIEFPLYALEIVNDQLEVETRYEKPGKYLINIAVTNGRIHIDRLIKQGEYQYSWLDQDTIVCNEEVIDKRLEGVGWYASKDRGKLYFVQLTEEVKAKSRIKLLLPEKVTYDTSELLVLQARPQNNDIYFYAYERGHLKGKTTELAEAISLAYEFMGVVLDSEQNMVWNRINRRNYATIDNPQAAAYSLVQQLENISDNQYHDNLLMMDAMGCTVQQMFYYIDKGYPVVAYTSSDNYLLICGFDGYNISLYDPGDKKIYKMGIQTASDYFLSLKNDFICSVPVK